MADKEFINGLSAKAPHDKAPEFVKARLSIKNAELIEYLQARVAQGEEWTNVDVKVSKGGTWYAERDPWKPNQDTKREPRQSASRGGGGGSDGFVSDPVGDGSDDIPFVTKFGKW